MLAHVCRWDRPYLQPDTDHVRLEQAPSGGGISTVTKLVSCKHLLHAFLPPAVDMPVCRLPACRWSARPRSEELTALLPWMRRRIVELWSSVKS